MTGTFRAGMAGTALALLVAGQAEAQTALSQVDAETGGPQMAEHQPGSQAGLDVWLAGFRTRAIAAGVSASVTDAALRGLAYDPAIVKKDRNQNEFTKTIWDYLDTAVSEDRVALGIKALQKNADLLDRIEARYGVDKEVVAAIWGLESAYGTYRGDVPTLDALATLAYDGRRGAFFEAQLLAALRILDTGEVTAGALKGSWAGAMGHTQFMPSSWHEFAVDFTGDGRRDIWGDDPADALASAAAYLAAKGWTKDAPWGLEVALPPGFDYEQTTERVKKPVPEWAAMGVRPMAGGALPGTGDPGQIASVLLPGGARGAAFLIFPNFQVIESYNTADAYVIAVGHLADRLRGGPPIRAEWPRELRALSLDERRDLQARLTAAGFDAGGVDGLMGPKTIAAVKAWQKANGRIPDGYPSTEVLDALP